MNKLPFLNAKIRLVRQELRLKQKDFVAEVSKHLDPRERGPLSQALASQWESGKTNPRPEQICAIANLTKQPWKTMAWFMHLDLEPNRVVHYRVDGSYVLAPATTEANGYEIFLELDKQASEEPAPFLTAWQEDANKIYEITAKLMDSTPVEIKGENPESTSEVDIHAKALDLEKEKLANQGKAATSADEKQKKKTALQGGLAALLALRVDQVVRFPEQKSIRPSLTAEEDGYDWRELDEQAHRYTNFHQTLVYFLSQVFIAQEVKNGFNRKIGTGRISIVPYFYSHGVSVVMEMLQPSTRVVEIPSMINDRIGQLLLIDRLKRKSAKKLVLFSFYEFNLDLKWLLDQHEDHIKDAKAMGITVAFVSGAAAAATQIAELMSASTAEHK